ncbi:MAG: VWA domain-containing protein [Hyphomicrobium sp.]|uniref:TadE/TadG family type IV pilus assembly protein n=1 Tax=Hyphomicrobium sp. TaxID=82 RepID=UPI003D0C57AA
MSPSTAPASIRLTRLAVLRRLGQDTSGSVAIMFALMFVALALFVGGAVDIGRWLQARQQTIAAMDAAVLAGGRVLQFDDQDVAGARLAASRYYAENVKDRTEVIDDTISFDAVENNTAFAATGNAYLRTTFLNFAHISRLPLLDNSQTQFSKAILRAGGQSNSDVEIAMMLDVTGSMMGTKITDLKTAATDLVNIVISDAQNMNPVRMAIIPFAEGVRLPSSANTMARGNPSASVTVGSGRNARTYYRTPCVVERKGTNKFTDVAPGANNYVMTLYDSDGSCLPTADELMPLTKDKDALKSRIQNLVLSGSTAGQVGTAWAWYTLSPNWNTLWGASSAASAFGSGTRKIAILMTDGEYNLQYNTNGVSASTGVNGSSTTQARSLCAAMKDKSITVYTVGFALGGNQTAIETLNQCATNPSTAYTADNGAQLKQAFRDIALKINQLYLTH